MMCKTRLSFPRTLLVQFFFFFFLENWCVGNVASLELDGGSLMCFVSGDFLFPFFGGGGGGGYTTAG